MAAHAEAVSGPGIDPFSGGLHKHIEKFINGFGHPNIVLVLGRSRTLNVVVYEAILEGGVLAAEKPLDTYWLIIDPECLESARITAKEYADVRQDLSLLESVSFGVNSTPAGDDTFSVTLAAIPDRLFMLSLVDGRPWLHSTISGELASVSRAFMAIDSAEDSSCLVATKAQWVDLCGYSILTGELLRERIVPSR